MSQLIDRSINGLFSVNLTQLNVDIKNEHIERLSIEAYCFANAHDHFF